MEFHESFIRGVKVPSTWQMIDNGEQIGITRYRRMAEMRKQIDCVIENIRVLLSVIMWIHCTIMCVRVCVYAK